MVRFQRQPPGTALTRTSSFIGMACAVAAAVLIVDEQPVRAGVLSALSGGLLLIGGHRANHGLGGPVARMLTELFDRAWDACVLAPIIWDRLAPYQQKRLLTFIDPTADPRASGYHVIQSKVAIGSGGFFGKGFTMGTQKRLAFLPEQHTDFIFSVVGEELGFIGVAIALSLFLWLFLRLTQVAERANDSYSSLVAFGLMSSWFVHVLVNVGMTLNLMPITGIPLPFFSYGGSFMLASWLAVGILMRISGEGRGSALSLRR